MDSVIHAHHTCTHTYIHTYIHMEEREYSRCSDLTAASPLMLRTKIHLSSAAHRRSCEQHAHKEQTGLTVFQLQEDVYV